jgi:hypothetical protein
MADLSEMLGLLQKERDRYVLEIGDLEHRLSFVRNQITSLETLISGYCLEDQSIYSQKHLSSVSAPTALLLKGDERTESASTWEVKATQAEKSAPAQAEPDISDIPKLANRRKPGTIPLLKEFQEYSIQNAILILMRRRPDLHFQLEAIVRDLYGDTLTPAEVKAVKTSTAKALTTGAQQSFWYRVLNTNDVYTLHHEKGVTVRLKSK